MNVIYVPRRKLNVSVIFATLLLAACGVEKGTATASYTAKNAPTAPGIESFGQITATIKNNLHPDKAGLGNHSSSNDGEATIVVASAAQSGDLMRLKGEFSGRLPFRKFSSRNADMTDVVTIENGRFDVTLPPVQK